MRQTFQKLTQIIKWDLLELRDKREKGFSGCGFYDFSKFDFQDYFYEKKQKNPNRYERMFFNTNGQKPYSEDLEQIRTGLIASGFLKYSLVIAGE